MEVFEYGMKRIKEDNEFSHILKGEIVKEEPLEILKGKIIKEEPSEIEAFSKYNNACVESHLEQNQDGYKSHPELENSKCILFNDGIIVKNEDCTDDLSIQTGTIETEDNTDIVHKDYQAVLYEEPSIKIESNTSSEVPTGKQA
ncbi:hypothetical protein JTB14_025649 [Gonioctena quinquepunctata]|nr:hypothetical protein JTB14_025649 [Gonioctena quinquepunctata]